MPFEIGENVGFYQVLAQLGQGGMATVFKAHHTVLDRDVAIKVLNPAFLEDPNFMSRFRREARAIASLDHPHIVPVFEFAEHAGIPFLVMKFIEGETLKSRLWHDPPSRQQVCEILEAVGSALAYAHQRGVLHRDIKPSNVLMANDGGIYLSDFGLARIVADGTSTMSREMLIGTPQYISPEQAMGLPDLDARTDIYSLGIVMYELIVGRVPFDADTPISIIHGHLYNPPPLPSSLAPDVSPALEQVILRALAKKREDRCASVEEMLAAFRQAREQECAAPVPAPEATAVDALPGQQAFETVLEVDRLAPQVAVLITTGGVRFSLIGGRIAIGRVDPARGISPDIDLTEAEPVDPRTGKRRRTVHREHARLIKTNEGWRLEILPGKEGRSWLNGVALESGRPYPLHPGDVLKLGAVELRCSA